MNNFLRIRTHNSVLIMEWLGLIDTIDYRGGHQHFFKALEKSQNTLWLLNYKTSGDIEMEDREWTMEEWLPMAMQAIDGGVEKIAVVVPDNIFNKVSVRILTTKIKSTKHNVDIAFFNEEKEAESWLLAEEIEEQTA